MYISDSLAEIQVSYSNNVPVKDRIQIKSQDDAFNICKHIWSNIEYTESLYVLFINRANHLIGYRLISQGGLDGVLADIRVIFGIALKCCASSIIVAHNHPSGNIMPSIKDIELTKRIVTAGKTLNISVFDHLIVSFSEDYYSFRQEHQNLFT